MLIREYGGYLFRSCRNSKYVYKLGKVQIGETRSIAISFEQAPVGYCHIAIWHSHPAGFYSSRIEKKYNSAKEKYEHFIINSTLDGDANKSGLSIDDKAFGFGYVINKRIKTNNPEPLLLNKLGLPLFTIQRKIKQKVIKKIPLVKGVSLNNYFDSSDFSMYLITRRHDFPMMTEKAEIVIYDISKKTKSYEIIK